MNDELTRFSNLFPDEKPLTNAIASLLRNREDVTGVDMTHGRLERGKDIIFYVNDPLGERKLYACVVKNHKITGSVDSNRGAMEVLKQVIQALENPYLNPAGQHDYVTHVYVMTPHEVSQSAMHSIQGGLRSRSGQITFCCGGKLLALFKKYVPTVLFESGELGSYVAHLQLQIEKENPVAAFLSEHSIFGSPIGLNRTYVKQRFHCALVEYTCRLSLPSLSEFASPMLQETALELRSQLWKASELISLPQLWYGTATLEEVGNLAKALSDTGEAVVEAWHKSYDRERKAEQERREAVLPKKRAKLSIRDVLAKSKALYEGERKKAHQTEKTALLMISLGDDIIHRLESDLTRARQYIQALSIRISEANAFVRSTREVDASTLTSRGYLTYCSVREVAHRVPDLVQPTCKEQIFFLPGEVFENIRSAILITGSAGHGKTSFCKNYALADSKALVNKDSDVLPVFVRLHHLASRELGSFEEEFFSAPELRALMSKDGDATKVQIGKIRVYLDGLDEVPRLERQRELMELARSAVNADPRVQIVVTGRNYVNGPWLNWMPRVAITELDDNQILELVSSLLGNNDHEIKKFFRELGKVSTLQPLMKVPLLSTLTVLVYKKGTPLPENRVKLYEAFVNLMCGGWDLAKNVPRRVSFGSVVKLSLLTRLAGDMQRKRVRDCKKNSIQAALDSLNPDYSDRFGELLEELLQDGLLTRGGEVYAFCHQSFQEFLAAKELNDPTGRRQKAILRKYFQGDDWWFQTLSFYIASTTKPDDTEYWLRTTKEELQFSNSLANDALDRYRQLIANLVESAPGYSPVSLPVSDYV